MGPWDWFWAGRGRLGRVRSVRAFLSGCRVALRSAREGLAAAGRGSGFLVCAVRSGVRIGFLRPCRRRASPYISARRATGLDDGPRAADSGAEAPESEREAGACAPASSSRPPAPNTHTSALLSSHGRMSPSFIPPTPRLHFMARFLHVCLVSINV